MSIIDSLIYDRTAADTAALEALFAKAKAGTITDEEWSVLGDPAHKGAYNYTDLNRVTAATEYIRGMLEGYGYYLEGYVPGRQTWLPEDNPTPEELMRYADNIWAIRRALILLPDTPPPPGDMDDLTAEEANAIEKILVDAETQLSIMATTFIPCGEALCGGDNL